MGTVIDLPRQVLRTGAKSYDDFPIIKRLPEPGTDTISNDGVMVNVTKITPVADYFVIAGTVIPTPGKRFYGGTTAFCVRLEGDAP